LPRNHKLILEQGLDRLGEIEWLSAGFPVEPATKTIELLLSGVSKASAGHKLANLVRCQPIDFQAQQTRLALQIAQPVAQGIGSYRAVKRLSANREQQ